MRNVLEEKKVDRRKSRNVLSYSILKVTTGNSFTFHSIGVGLFKRLSVVVKLVEVSQMSHKRQYDFNLLCIAISLFAMFTLIIRM